MENTILYYDILSNDLYDEAGNLFGNRILDIFLNNHMNLEVHYVALDGSQTDDPTSFPPWTGLTDVTVASSVAVDNNMQHAIKGVLAEELSIGSVSSIKVTAASTTINPTGTIVLIDGAGERLGVPYTAVSYANGAYTFTVSVSLDQAYPTGSTVRVPEALIMKAEGDDVDDSKASQGIFVFKLYALSHKLIELLDYSNTSSISATMQHKIISEGEVVRTFEYEFVIRNVLEFENDSYVPAAGPDEVATKSWVLSFYRSPFEYQFSVDKSEWHDVQTNDDRYYRQRIKNSGSEYGDPIVMIVGPKGDAGTTPSINSSNNHWMLGETDTGVSATGPAGADGIDGETPYIDANSKHWFIGTQDTGVVAEGKDGTTPRIGENGNWFIGDTDTGVSAGSGYELPVASSDTLGGIKVGANLSITDDGVLNANASQYELPIASTSTLGGIKISPDFTIDEDGTLHTTSSGGSGYVLPVATVATLGGVKQGTNVTIAADGTLSATDTTYPVATSSQDGLMSAADKTKLDGIDTTGSSGDMLKSVYDTNDDGIVDHAATADAVGATTAAQVADAVGKAHTHANKATLDKLAETDGKLTFDGAEIGGGSGTVKSVNGQLPDESGNVTIETGGAVDESRLLPENPANGDIPCFDTTATVGGGNDANTRILLHFDADEIKDEAAGNAAPVTITKKTGTITVVEGGKWGKCAKYVTGSMTVATNLDELNANNWVVSGWFNPDENNHGVSYPTWLSMDDQNTHGFGFDSTGRYGESDGPLFYLDTPPASGTWHWLAIVKYSGGLRFYLNGAFLNEISAQQRANFCSTLAIGGFAGTYAAGSTERTFSGLVDEVRLQYIPDDEITQWTGTSIAVPDAPYSKPQTVGEWGKLNKSALVQSVNGQTPDSSGAVTIPVATASAAGLMAAADKAAIADLTVRGIYPVAKSKTGAVDFNEVIDHGFYFIGGDTPHLNYPETYAQNGGTLQVIRSGAYLTQTFIPIVSQSIAFIRHCINVPSGSSERTFSAWRRLLTDTEITESKARPGYFKLPGGTIVQWGVVLNITADGTTSVTLPIAFPNSAFVATTTATGSGLIASAAFDGNSKLNVIVKGYPGSGSFTVYWIAIGY